MVYIRNVYGTAPSAVVIGNTYDVELTVNVDDIAANIDYLWYKLEFFDLEYNLLTYQFIKGGESQQQWKFKVKLKKTKLGPKLVPITVELSKYNPNTGKLTWVDKDTVSFLVTGYLFGNLPPFVPELPELPQFPSPPKENNNVLAIGGIVLALTVFYFIVRGRKGRTN